MTTSYSCNGIPLKGNQRITVVVMKCVSSGWLGDWVIGWLDEWIQVRDLKKFKGKEAALAEADLFMLMLVKTPRWVTSFKKSNLQSPWNRNWLILFTHSTMHASKNMLRCHVYAPHQRAVTRRISYIFLPLHLCLNLLERIALCPVATKNASTAWCCRKSSSPLWRTWSSP